MQYDVVWTAMPDPDGKAESFKFIYDDEVLGLGEAREIKKWTGLNPPQWLAAVGQDDPEALAAMACLLLRRAGEPELRFTDVDLNYRSMKITSPDAPLDPPDADSEAS